MKTMIKGEGQCLGKERGTDGAAFSFMLSYIVSVNAVLPLKERLGKILNMMLEERCKVTFHKCESPSFKNILTSGSNHIPCK